jgi:hypothetical protein
MEEAIDSVAGYFLKKQQSALFEALLPALEGPLPDGTYDSLARELGTTGQALRQASVRLRQRYRQALLEIAGVRLGIASPLQLEAELRDLLAGG